MANWGDPSWGNTFATGDPSTQDPTRNANVYELRDNDTPSGWAQRVWQQSTADYGKNNLNPYAQSNPTYNSPFARWYQSRYGTAAPTNMLTNNLLANTPMTAWNVANGLKGIQQSGDPSGSKTGYTDMNVAKNNLDAVNAMVKNHSTGNNANLSAFQQGMADKIMNDPAMSTQMILSQLQGATGGWGMDYMGNRLSNLATQYYNDPANNGPQASGGPFFNQALSLLGLA